MMDNATLLDRDILRAQAVKARQNLKYAEKLLKRAQEEKMPLSRTEHRLVMKLESGELHWNRADAEKAYGHGQTVKKITVEESAVIRAYSTDVLARYWSTIEYLD